MHDLEPLSGELSTLLGAERAARDPAAQIKQRVWQQVVEAAATPMVQPASVDSSLPQNAVSTASVGGALKGALLFALGAVSGVAGTHYFADAPAHVTEQVQTQPLPPLEVVALPPVQPVVIPTPAPIKRATPRTDLAAEQLLIERVRSALVKNLGESALESVGLHQNRFPHGALSEERDALRVQALLVLGRTEEARVNAQRFVQMYPQSLFASLVRTAL